jgi:hypothetical protein
VSKHYRNRRLCRVPEALGKALKNTRQRLCRMSHSARGLDIQCIGKAVFAEYFSQALGKEASLPSADPRPSAKAHGRQLYDGRWRPFAERHLCRTRQTCLCRELSCAECPALGKPARYRETEFAECGSRQSHLCRVRLSAKRPTLGKVPNSGNEGRHSTKYSLSSVDRGTLSKDFFKKTKTIFDECLSVGIRQRILCQVSDSGHSTKYFFKSIFRVPDRGHSAKNITLIDPHEPPSLSFTLSLNAHHRAPPPQSPPPPPPRRLGRHAMPHHLRCRCPSSRRRTRARWLRAPRLHSASPGPELSLNPRFVPYVGENLSCHLDLWCSDIDGRTLVE